MKILAELKERFQAALSDLIDEDVTKWSELVRPAQDTRFGDYQANCAMPLGKRLGRPPREVANEIVSRLDVAELCSRPEVAGPGFVNLRLSDEWIVRQLESMVGDDRLGIAHVERAQTYVVDYSSPNVAKPMHVGHIRSTVIGDAICRTLRFLGHHVISDNHLGDWGTQFGMIIYGFKHFVDKGAYQEAPVAELSRLYKLVHQLVEYHSGRRRLPSLKETVAQRQADVEQAEVTLPDQQASDKKQAKLLRRLKAQAAEAQQQLESLQVSLNRVDSDAQLAEYAEQHAGIEDAVLHETAKLHSGDPENRRLWEEFLPSCRGEIQRIYDRIHIHFDHEYGESFYQDRLAAIVEDFQQREFARESEGAVCVFLNGFATPMIIRKKDGAFLYATTDLATIQWRMEEWKPDSILYVVDHRQAEHFEKLFAVARLWGFEGVDLRHISFGTVMGADRRPYKTRSGDTVGLEGLLNEAVDRAFKVVSENDDAKPLGPELDTTERRTVAQVIGHAAIKYADLSHNRTSDYVFSYDKMLGMQGNTATYMQYSYARVNGIFSKGGVDVAPLRQSPSIQLAEPQERALGLELLKLGDALDEVLADYRPNQLTDYLFDLTKVFFAFYEHCAVLQASSPELRNSRLLLCDLTAGTIRQGLELLGIDVVEKM